MKSWVGTLRRLSVLCAALMLLTHCHWRAREFDMADKQFVAILPAGVSFQCTELRNASSCDNFNTNNMEGQDVTRCVGESASTAFTLITGIDKQAVPSLERNFHLREVAGGWASCHYGKITRYKDIKLAGADGRDFDLETPVGAARARVLSGKGLVVMALAVPKQQDAANAEIEPFINGLRARPSAK